MNKSQPYVYMVMLICFTLSVGVSSADATSAASAVGDKLKPEWRKCDNDSDCVLTYGCPGDAAVNKKYESQALDVAIGIVGILDCYQPRPMYEARCITNRCEAIKSPSVGTL